MRKMKEKLRELFAKSRLNYSMENFVIVGLPGIANVAIGGEGFSAVIKEKGETTLILPAEKWLELGPTLKNAKMEGPFRILTFDIPLEWAVVGFMAEVTRILAEEGISLGAISGYSHDHFFVKTEDAGKAIEVIGKLILDCKAETGVTAEGDGE